MKKLTSILLLFFCIGMVSSSYAQKRVTESESRSAGPTEFRKVQFGLGLGLNSSTLRADWGDLGASPLAGFNFGTYIKFRFTSVVGFQPGVQISTQGSNFDYDVRIELTYIQVPVVLKIYAFKGLNFDIGPQMGLLVSAKLYDPVEDKKNGWNDFITPIDVALRLGINYEFKFGLCITTHYNLGLTNINDSDDRDDLPINNGVLQLGVGFYF